MNALVAQLRMDAKRIAADLATRPRPIADHSRLRERIIQIQAIGSAAKLSVPQAAVPAVPSDAVLCPSCYLAGRPLAIMTAAPQGERPALLRCPACGHEAVEEVDVEAGARSD